MKLTTASTWIQGISIVASLVYSYALLNSIKAPAYLYGLLILTMVITVVSLTISASVRDESLKEQFENLRQKYQG